MAEERKHKYTLYVETEFGYHRECRKASTNEIKELMLKNKKYAKATCIEYPRCLENVRPILIKNVTGHVELHGSYLSYVTGLTRYERAEAAERTENGICPNIVARIKYRKGAKWYWLQAINYLGIKRTEVEYVGYAYKEYRKVSVKATPVESPEVIAYLNKKWPMRNETREYIAPRVTPPRKNTIPKTWW